MDKTVYVCFSTDILHGGHIAIIKKARELGKLIVGVMTDEAVASYKRYPLVSYSDRKAMFECLEGVYKVVTQKSLSYKENLLKFKPDYVVHGDDWKEGLQEPIRKEVIEILDEYGGKLIEFPYTYDAEYNELEKRAREDLALPDIRRGRLKRAINLKGMVIAMEAHDGLTGLIVEKTVVYENGNAHQFDAMWLSSLCDSTAKGKPDIELVDMTSRFRTVEDLMEVTTKPIIFDGDTGGRIEHFAYTVRSLERMGVSMVIIEDKIGPKKNSLFGTEVVQTQDTPEDFAMKIKAGKKAQKTKDFMICARIESLILEKGIEDALKRAFIYVDAGADAIMIHSRKAEPDEVFEFISLFREKDSNTPLVVVPTSYNTVTEEEFKKRGVNVVIYANQLMRAMVPAARKAADTILHNHRGAECDEILMPFSEIIRMIPEE
jgi:phosphoenolpyruvate phosphomutase